MGLASPDAMRAAFYNLQSSAKETANRGYAAGLIDENKAARMQDGVTSGTRHRRLKKDGTLSKTTEAAVIKSGVVGAMGASPRFPTCRQTVWTLRNPDKFAASMPLFREAGDFMKQVMPDRYNAQRYYIDQIHPDFKISNTPFTTVTVNLNTRTAYHYDAGDLANGFGVMAVLRAGDWSGGYLTFPKWRVAVNTNINGSFVAAAVHDEVHGNTEIKHHGKSYIRLTLVLYCREDIIHCGSAEEELERAKAMQPGQPGVLKTKMVDIDELWDSYFNENGFDV